MNVLHSSVQGLLSVFAKHFQFFTEKFQDYEVVWFNMHKLKKIDSKLPIYMYGRRLGNNEGPNSVLLNKCLMITPSSPIMANGSHETDRLRQLAIVMMQK